MGPSPLPKSTLTLLDDTYRRRWETLAAVDEMVEKVHKALTDNKLLSKTYVIFTSDNGYHIGDKYVYMYISRIVKFKGTRNTKM